MVLDTNDELNRLYICAENYDPALLEKYMAVRKKIRESDPSQEVIDWLNFCADAAHWRNKIFIRTKGHLQMISWEVKAFCEQFPKNGN